MLHDSSKDRPTDAAGWILWNAADLIERNGWCQNAAWKMDDKNGQVIHSYCVSHAIILAANAANELPIEATHRMQRAVGGVISIWNDILCRTQTEAVAKLRETALAGPL